MGKSGTALQMPLQPLPVVGWSGISVLLILMLLPGTGLAVQQAPPQPEGNGKSRETRA